MFFFNFFMCAWRLNFPRPVVSRRTMTDAGGFKRRAGCRNRGGCRYDPPISCGAMLLRNITTALKFYLSSPLIQVDQGGGWKVGWKSLRSVRACTCFILPNTSSVCTCHPSERNQRNTPPLLCVRRSRQHYRGCKDSSGEEATCCWRWR